MVMKQGAKKGYEFLLYRVLEQWDEFIVSSTRAMAYPARIELILTAESETAFPPSSELSNLFKNKTKKKF